MPPKRDVKITCLSLDCPERKSVCCGASSIASEELASILLKYAYPFACKNCGKEFVGGECKMNNFDPNH